MRHKAIHQLKIGGVEKYRALELMGRFSTGGLVILLACLVFPCSLRSAEALNSEAWTSMPSSLSVGLTEPPAMTIWPSATGDTGTATAQLRVGTTSNSGYKVYIKTSDETNAMVHDTMGVELSAMSSTRPLADLENNTWGFAFNGEDSYRAVPVESTLIKDVTAAVADTTYDLQFAARMDTSLPAGEYSNTVEVSVIANPQKLTGLLNLIYMQDMTSSICQSTLGANGVATISPGNEPTKQLIDNRDGKSYWVAKMADGNCWMTQNLAFDLVKGRVLYPSNTDLVVNWTVSATTETAVPAASNETDAVRSWNLGNYVVVTPAVLYMPDGSYIGCDVPTGQWLSGACKNMYDVTGKTDQFVAQAGDWNGVNYDYVTVDQTTGNYDAHYLVGDYYSYGAATAGTGVDLNVTTEEQTAAQLVNATGSICPKGWRLPRSGANTTTASSQYLQPFDLDDSWYRLFRAYGYPATGSYEVVRGMPATSMLNGENQNIYKGPMKLVGAGVTSPTSAMAPGVGVSALYRTSTMRGGTQAYLMYINGNAGVNRVAAAYWNFRRTGGSVRCVAK